ncbi:MAG: MBL fold metallo-hydrolase [Clostridia bacterium]|nr:MBL fold metallo-hydrolase [Clostridia bacterium]
MSVKRITVGELGTNCYIYCDDATGRCAIIDPGDFDDYLQSVIEKYGTDKFDYILLTHCHFDHVAGVSSVKELTGAKIGIFLTDAPGLRDMFVNLSAPFTGRGEVYPKPDVEFADREKFKVGETEFTVMHTPGHTVGSCCFITDGIIFSGDTLFHMSAGRTDFPGGSMTELRNSLRRLAELEGNYKVYPGHEDTTSLSYERLYNMYM